MIIESRVSRGIVAFALAMAISAVAVLGLAVGLLLICATREQGDFSCPLAIAGALAAFVGVGLLPCITSRLYEGFGKNSPAKLDGKTRA